jgi:hypothetical protein
MSKKGPSLREVLLSAVKWVPDAWTADERLNTTGLQRYFKDQGHPISQPTLHRLLVGTSSKPRKLQPETIEALHAVLKIPRSMLRGDPMSADTERATLQYGLDVFLLAQKIAELPPTFRNAINTQIDEWLKRETHLKKSPDDSVVSMTRRSS